MKRTIELIISPTGDLKLDAIGFKGSDCEKATAFLEQALGQIQKRDRKPEYQNRNRITTRQQVGS
jgi:hypothetical protein